MRRRLLLFLFILSGQVFILDVQAEECGDGEAAVEAALRAEYRVQVGRSEQPVFTADEEAALAPVLGGGRFRIWTHRFGKSAYAARLLGENAGRPRLEWFRLAVLDGIIRVNRIEADEALLAMVLHGDGALESAFFSAVYGTGGQWESVRVSRDLGGAEVLEGRARTPLGAVETVRVRLNRNGDELTIEERRLESVPESPVASAWVASAEEWVVEGPARWSSPQGLRKLEFLARRGSVESKYRLALELLQLKDVRARAEAVLWLKEAKAEGRSDAAILLQQLATGMGRLPEDRAFTPHPTCVHPTEGNTKGTREVQRHEILTSRETR